MGRLFGTDGARGIANTELTCELAMQIGRAAAVVLTKHTSLKPKIIIARDTRISSEMLEAALTAGICSVGADVELLGVIPTPAVAYLVPKYGADAGIMISASHNPVEYNGIKLFSKTGYKLSDDLEEEIEALILDTPEKINLKQGIELGRVYRRNSAVSDYIELIKRSIDIDLSGINVAVDCANGSASATADQLFRELGATAHIIHANPNGMNINEKCGSTNLEALIYYMKVHGCEIGVAFDGDADRCLAVDENGNRVDGDQLIAIFAKYLKQQDKLNKNTAVVTVMSNFGMRQFGKENEIDIVATSVGDRYVLEEMLRSGYNLGGEDSGHIIFKDFAQTGDGQLSAVQLLSIYKKSGRKMSDLASTMKKSPQVSKNIPATPEDKAMFMKDDIVVEVIAQVERELGEEGRVLVRASGTEPVIRVMIEGNEFKVINEYCERICNVIKERLA
ncbi:phosphoglucosamine mutase [Paludicola sp. MB14-C6]|uniref:phosphoglucosamine mutase n=1 Tax=Paludihabitans sp. MB14-C6 TaxID=3070656 RepID=UPI0027DDDE7D|nr:phosphoglucosamine mutase [Paludicola sp. MB14-C6]WMJ23293.1 phosphoglucosamine mutase [Paludicola sp. MB14-C6]